MFTDSSTRTTVPRTTRVTSHNPVRTDLATGSSPEAVPSTAVRRGWAFAGLGAGVAGLVTVVASGMVDAGYAADVRGDLPAIQQRLSEQQGAMLTFHVAGTLAAVLLVVFAAGLHRRLRAVLPDSLVPSVAAAGLVGTAVVLVLGTGLDTEFALDIGNSDLIAPSSAVMYNHWVATIAWCWVLAGVAGLGLFVASRRGGAARWLGLVGLVLGGLTVLLGISPLQYMAGLTGPLWLVVTSLGLAFGDRRHREG